jgi:hypothetical protein
MKFKNNKKFHVNKLSGKSECFFFVEKKKEDAFNLELLEAS